MTLKAVPLDGACLESSAKDPMWVTTLSGSRIPSVMTDGDNGGVVIQQKSCPY